MFYAYLDASALAKRYIPEPGTAEVNHVFTRLPLPRLIVLNVGAAEVASLLVRKRNAGRLSPAFFQQAIAEFVAEIVAPVFPIKLAADNAVVVAAFALIESHSINSTDAIVLQSALNLADELRPNGNDLLIVSTDQRLLRAAKAEGIATFDPENDSINFLDKIIGP